MFERIQARLAGALTRLQPTELRSPPGLLVPSFDVGEELGFPANYASYASEGMSKNELVFAAIREIATSFAEFPLRVWQTDRGRKVPVDDHPFRRLIARPNPFHDSEYDFWEVLQTYYHLAGETFVFKARNAAGVTTELWPVRPDQIGHIPAPAGAGNLVDVWFFESEPGAKKVPIVVDDLIQIRIPDPQDPIRGLSPIKVAAANIDADNRANQFVNTFMANQGVPSGAIKVDAEYDANLQKRLERQWQQRHAGPGRSGRVMVLWKDIEYQQFAVAPRQMALPDLRRVSETRILMALGMPPIVVQSFAGLERSTFTNYSEARTSLYDETILPLCAKFCGKFQARFAAADPRQERDVRGLRFQTGQELRFDRTEIRALQEDTQNVWTRVTGAVRAGVVPWQKGLGLMGISPEELDPDDVLFIAPGVLPAQTGQISDGSPDTNPVPPGAMIPGDPDPDAGRAANGPSFVRVRDLLPAVTGLASTDEIEGRAVALDPPAGDLPGTPAPRRKRRR